MPSPQILVISGANGSGKSTTAHVVLPASVPFLNADDIAVTLLNTEGAARDLIAGRLLLEQWRVMAEKRCDFAIETTLSSRSLANRIEQLKISGYQFHLIYFWLSSPELAVARVAERSRRGGHSISENVIRRRYRTGLNLFFTLYQPMSHSWRVFDNSRIGESELVASGTGAVAQQVYQEETFAIMRKSNYVNISK
jgi:predicted ABC-type ATPase